MKTSEDRLFTLMTKTLNTLISDGVPLSQIKLFEVYYESVKSGSSGFRIDRPHFILELHNGEIVNANTE